MKAVHLPDPERCAQFDMGVELKPGEYFIAECPEGHFYMHFGCPCGTGHRCAIALESKEQPVSGSKYVWNWNGIREPITVSPSIYQGEFACKWHGWLQNGEWRSV